MDNVWTNLGNRLETAWKRPTRPNSKRPKDGEIIDEEKSVRWNREDLGVDAQLEQSNVTVDLYPYFIEDSYNSVVNGVTPASTTVEAYVPTLYSLIVPESVTLGGNAGSGEKTATLPVMVKGDIGLSQEVNVSTTPPTMKSNKAADVLASVETPKAVWNRDDTLASITSNYTVKANLTPGDWSGTVSFVCSVSEN